MKKTVLILNRSFPPDGGATGRLLSELCEDLSAELHVMVITGASPHFHSREEKISGVNVLRTPFISFSKKFLLGRLFNWGYYFLGSLFKSLRIKADLIVCETDPPFLSTIGYLNLRLRKIPYIYYCQDLYPDVAVVLGNLRYRPLIMVFEWWNKVLLRNAKKVVVIGRDMERKILEKGISRDKILNIPNWVDIQKISPISVDENFFLKTQTPMGKKFIVMYSGNLGYSQDFDIILAAAAELRLELDIIFFFVGEGAEKKKLEDRVKALGLRNVEFVPYQSEQVLAHSLSAADLHIIPLHKNLSGLVVPSKVYGILAAGRPFVFIGDEGSEIYHLVKEGQCGFTVAPGDLKALREIILFSWRHQEVLREMGTRARHLAEQYYNRRIVTAQFQKDIQYMLG